MSASHAIRRPAVNGQAAALLVAAQKAMVGFGARREIGDGDDGGGGGGCVENAEFSVSSREGTREVGPIFFISAWDPPLWTG